MKIFLVYEKGHRKRLERLGLYKTKQQALDRVIDRLFWHIRNNVKTHKRGVAMFSEKELSDFYEFKEKLKAIYRMCAFDSLTDELSEPLHCTLGDGKIEITVHKDGAMFHSDTARLNCIWLVWDIDVP